MVTLVTGAAGYIGLRLVADLVADGVNVRAIALPHDRRGVRRLEALGVEVWPANLLDRDSLRGAGAEVATVFHLAGSHTADIDAVRRLYVGGTQNLCDELLSSGPPSLLIASSNSSVYGDCGDRSIAEDSLPGRPHPFGAITAAMEQQLLTAYTRAGLPVVLLRVADVYGAGRANIVDAIARGRVMMPGDGTNWTSHIHIDDLVRILRAAERLTIGQTYNVADEMPTRAVEFHRLAAFLAGVSAPVPAPADRLSDLDQHSFDSLRALSVRLSASKLFHAIGVRLDFPTIQEGLRALAAAPTRAD